MIGELWNELRRRNRLLAIATAVHLLLFIALLVASFIDPMQILGVSRWIKPMKFAISIAIFLGTMGWLLSYLPNCSRGVAIISRIITVSMSLEMILIAMQSMRGVRSHFNGETPFNAVVFITMGVTILINTIATAYAGYLFFRHPATVSGAYLTGIRLGLIIFVLATFEGGMMAAHGSHGVGVPDGGPGLPLVNWSTQAGDLRASHFVGMHALQALPFIGWFLDKRGTQQGRKVVVIASLVWFVVTALLLAQALAGKPLLAM